MKNVRATSIALVVGATILVSLAATARVTISVGDDASAVGWVQFFYGYPLSYFSVVRHDPDGRSLHPDALCLGGGWHLLVWSGDRRVHAMTYFQYVSRGENRYGDWINVQHPDSFEIPRPNLAYYFVGLAVLFVGGRAIRRFQLVTRLATGILVALAILIGFACCIFAETLPLYPIGLLVGWLAAFRLSTTAFRSGSTESPASPPANTAESLINCSANGHEPKALPENNRAE